MLAIKENRTSAFLGEGKIRLGIVLLAGLLTIFYVFRDELTFVSDFVSVFQSRSEVIFSSASTFLSIFWAAMLTIWGLLKSRATRYIERLTDNAIFQTFLQGLEIRLIVGLVAIGASFAMYIVNPTLAEAGPALAFAIWLLLYGAAIFLLFDSLLSARVVLD